MRGIYIFQEEAERGGLYTSSMLYFVNQLFTSNISLIFVTFCTQITLKRACLCCKDILKI